MLISLFSAMLMTQISIVETLPTKSQNHFYAPNMAPLLNVPLSKLPITSFTPGGWLRKHLELQRDGLTGNLGEISIWLTKEDNAWLNKEGKGKYGWEEVPYWLRGYAKIAFTLRDSKMIEETRFWVEGTLGSQRDNGDFGPIHNHSKGFRDLWAQMLMLQVLQSWWEFNQDERILPFMSRYFRWQMSIPDNQFLKDYWENSRGGDNLASVYWLYNRTGEPFLLELATKIDKNTANWRQSASLPNFHNVNIAQCFREPATYYQQSKKLSDLQASYRNQDFIREKYGQVPGGMFGSDENSRPGYDDPRQAVETCGMVEQLLSNQIMLTITGDAKWASNSEDVAFNTLPAAFTEDYKALRYLTAPNMAISDSKNHAPGIANDGPFLLMNPFSSRCCQHNHTSAWVNLLEASWMATQDNGLAVIHLLEGTVRAKVGEGSQVGLTVTSKYPFEEQIKIEVTELSAKAKFPLYILIPTWAKGATVSYGKEKVKGEPGSYVHLERDWKVGDTVSIRLPMKPQINVWDQMKDSVSVNYGALTFSLLIEEELRQVDGTTTAVWDAGWQPGADQKKWPTHEILPKSAWNFGLVKKPSLKVVKSAWPTDNLPFSNRKAPLKIIAEGKQIPGWGIDEHGLVSILPKSPVKVNTPVKQLTLVPMGGARLRISSFPTVE